MPSLKNAIIGAFPFFELRLLAQFWFQMVTKPFIGQHFAVMYKL